MYWELIQYSAEMKSVIEKNFILKKLERRDIFFIVRRDSSFCDTSQTIFHKKNSWDKTHPIQTFTYTYLDEESIVMWFWWFQLLVLALRGWSEDDEFLKNDERNKSFFLPNTDNLRFYSQFSVNKSTWKKSKNRGGVEAISWKSMRRVIPIGHHIITNLLVDSFLFFRDKNEIVRIRCENGENHQLKIK